MQSMANGLSHPAQLNLTARQRSVLLSFPERQTAQDLGVRSDVLWRLEEKHLVSRGGFPERWTLTAEGRDLAHTLLDADYALIHGYSA